ncbi:MAG: ABC transporter permease, partial [Thermoanaerobaculia bacterium]
MSPSLSLRMLLRESRGSRGRLAFFIACLAVGVAAVVAVAGLSDSLDEGVRREARPLLGADLAVESNRPLPPALDRAAGSIAGVRRTDLRETVTVASAPARNGRPGPSQLVELRVVDGVFPFYGTLELQPRRPLHELLTPRTAVVASELLARLGLRVGDSLRIGGEPFRIAGVVLSEPDRVSISLTLGPRVFLSGEGFKRTPLAGRGSRIEYRALFKLPEDTSEEELRQAAQRIETALPDTERFRVETWRQAQPTLRRQIERVERFLG